MMVSVQSARFISFNHRCRGIFVWQWQQVCNQIGACITSIRAPNITTRGYFKLLVQPTLRWFEWVWSFTIPGCDHLQNSLVSLLNKLQRMTVERDGSFPVSGRSFSATSGHAPRIWEQRILLIFSRFWYLILFTFFFTFIYVFFLAFKFGWVVNNTFFFSVTNSEHI